MMKHIFLSLVLLVGAAVVPGWAQDQNKNADENKDAAAQATARLEEPPPSTTVPVFVLGSVKVPIRGEVVIFVTSARDANGAGRQDLVGRTLNVTGRAVKQLEPKRGAIVELQGQLKDDRDFEVASFTERRTATAAESGKVQGAIAPVGNPRGAINAVGSSEVPTASGNRPPIGALNDPKGAGVNKPNRGVIGAHQGRLTPKQPELVPDLKLPPTVVTAPKAVR